MAIAPGVSVFFFWHEGVFTRILRDVSLWRVLLACAVVYRAIVEGRAIIVPIGATALCMVLGVEEDLVHVVAA